MIPSPLHFEMLLQLSVIIFRGICQHVFHFIPVESSILSSFCWLPGRRSCQDVHTLFRGNVSVKDVFRSFALPARGKRPVQVTCVIIRA